MENNQKNTMNTAIRIFAIIGFVALIGGALWGTVIVARNVPGALSSLASAFVSLTSVFVPAGSENIVVSAPESVSSGDTVNITWTHEGKSGDGSYTFRYSCVDGISVTSPTPSGSAATVFCNTPFNFLNASDAISITVTSNQTDIRAVELYIDYTKKGENGPAKTGAVTVSVIPKSTTPTNTPSTPSVPRTPGVSTSGVYPISGGSSTSNPYGFIDLNVRVLEVGLVDKTTGIFTASSTPKRNLATHRVGVRFVIENLGTKTSDQWSFNAVLPTYPAHIFSSPNQQALGPGDRIEFTIGFDSFVDANEGTLVINVDPGSRINEPNKTNNILRYTVFTVK